MQRASSRWPADQAERQWPKIPPAAVRRRQSIGRTSVDAAPGHRGRRHSPTSQAEAQDLPSPAAPGSGPQAAGLDPKSSPKSARESPPAWRWRSCPPTTGCDRSSADRRGRRTPARGAAVAFATSAQQCRRSVVSTCVALPPGAPALGQPSSLCAQSLGSLTLAITQGVGALLRTRSMSVQGPLDGWLRRLGWRGRKCPGDVVVGTKQFEPQH